MFSRRKHRGWLSWFPWYRREARDLELERELRDHLELEALEQQEAGVPPQQAAYAAQRALGNTLKTEEDVRAAWGSQWLETIAQDVRYGARTLRRSPVFAIVAILTLALGIGANTAMFSVVDATLLHPLPYKDPARLVWLTESLPDTPDNNVSWLDMQDWKSQNYTLEGIAGYSDYKLAFSAKDSGNAQMLAGRFVSQGYFDLMGVAPLLGRTFSEKENAVGGPPVAVLSYSFWMENFAGNPAAIGQALRRNSKDWTIIGVMPEGFEAVTHTQIWLPFEQGVSKANLTLRQFSWGMYATGRLKPGITLEQARADISGISRRIEQQYPKTNAGLAVMIPLEQYTVGNIRPALLMLAAAVFFLLLIACSNIASLLLVKAVGRQKEIAIRLSLGAGKWRLFRQLIVESLSLSLVGAALGSLLALAGTRLIARLLPPGTPFANIISVDHSALLFTLGLTLLAGLSFGSAPALMALRVNLQGTLKSGAHQVQGGHRRVHRALVITEVGLAVALLIGTGLMIRSMMHLFRVAPGFDTQQLLSVDALPNQASVLTPLRTASIFDQALLHLRQLPGVESAATAYPVPFSDKALQRSWNLTFLAIKGRPARSGELSLVHTVSVSPDYFETLRVPLIEGRTFTAADTDKSLSVAVIDQEVARRYWSGQDPIGSQIKIAAQDFEDPSRNAVTIVGVVGAVKAGGLDADFGGNVYQPQDQQPNNIMTFVVRSRVAPQALAHSVESAIHEAMPGSPVFNTHTVDEMVQESQTTRRLSLRLLGAFSLGALLLAALGLYGVISYIVSQSTNEIGVRMALGAGQANILRLVLGQGMRLAFWGIGVGIVAALALTWLMSSLLYGVAATDPFTFAGVGILLAAVTLVACYVPARRAASVDPLAALRHE